MRIRICGASSPVPDKCFSVKSELQVTEVALVYLCLAFGMRDGRVDRGEEADQLPALPGLLTH